MIPEQLLQVYVCMNKTQCDVCEVKDGFETRGFCVLQSSTDQGSHTCKVFTRVSPDRGLVALAAFCECSVHQ